LQLALPSFWLHTRNYFLLRFLRPLPAAFLPAGENMPFQNRNYMFSPAGRKAAGNGRRHAAKNNFLYEAKKMVKQAAKFFNEAHKGMLRQGTARKLQTISKKFWKIAWETNWAERTPPDVNSHITLKSTTGQNFLDKHGKPSTGSAPAMVHVQTSLTTGEKF
jgi:hypothetical protein